MWSVLTNKVPTWDILQKRNFFVPGRCPLCTTKGESTQHLFIDCHYIEEVWIEVSRILKHRWTINSLEQAWRNWWENKGFKSYRLLPLLIIRGVWLARNEVIFNEVVLAPEKITLNSLAILFSFFPTEGRVKTRIIREVTIDKTSPWVFFMEPLKITIVGVEGFYTSHTHTTTL